jgi:cell division protein FtsN
MSKWEDSVKKRIIVDNQDSNCLCSNDQGLFVPNRQLSIVVAGLLFLFFTFFLTGYFLGKRYAIQQFTEKMYSESFSDQVYASVVGSNSVKTNNIAESIDIIDAQVHQLSIPQEINTSHPLTENEENPIAVDEQAHKVHYYAQLIGFATEKAAEKFVQKLSSKGIETTVKKHISKTAKGRTSQWYQVVTAPYENKNELMVVVNKLTREEMLKGVNVSTC